MRADDRTSVFGVIGVLLACRLRPLRAVSYSSFESRRSRARVRGCVCDIPASWPLNIRLSAAKTRMLHVLHCVVLVTFARWGKKRKRTTVQADSQGHVSHYHELMSRVWPVNAYFLLLTLTIRFFRFSLIIIKSKVTSKLKLLLKWKKRRKMKYTYC